MNIEAFRRLDRKVSEVNAQGLVAAPVMLWTLTESDPADAVGGARDPAVPLHGGSWGAHNVVWLLGATGVTSTVERWCRIGRAVFGDDHDRPVTMHPCGRWVGDWFGGEPWFDFLGYQSGHGLPEKTCRWIAQGPPAQKWRDLELPIINPEPNYEGHPAYGSDYRIGALDAPRGMAERVEQPGPRA